MEEQVLNGIFERYDQINIRLKQIRNLYNNNANEYLNDLEYIALYGEITGLVHAFHLIKKSEVLDKENKEKE